MKRRAETFWNDEMGMVVSAELVIIGTVAVLAMVVGLQAVARAVNTEMTDMANALYGLRQTYAYTGFRSGTFGKPKSYVSGGGFWAEQGNWRYAAIVGGDAYVSGGGAQDEVRSVEILRRGDVQDRKPPCSSAVPPCGEEAKGLPCSPCDAPAQPLQPEPEDAPSPPSSESLHGSNESGSRSTDPVELTTPTVTPSER